MGTPEFAVPSLRALVEAGHEIAAVYTQPDRPAGRGGKVAACPVKLWAQAHGLFVVQPERIRRPECVEQLRALAPDLMVTAAFGQILSQKNLDVPKFGCINVHASLLPKYRGAAPIAWGIANGETTFGVTTMMTDRGVDTGDILLQRSIPIEESDTTQTLTVKLSELGACLLIETIEQLERGELMRIPQDHRLATNIPMLTKEDGLIDWTRTADSIVNLIRAMDPWPVAWTELSSGALKVWKARRASGDAPGCQTALPGTIVCADPKRGLFVACGDGCVELLEVQAPGGKRMTAADFLRGKASLLPPVLDRHGW